MARYEKTIATKDYVVSILLPGTPTSVRDLLPSSIQVHINGLIDGNDILDGYIVSPNGFEVTRNHDDAAIETIPANERYLCPMENWIDNVLVKGSGNAIVRILYN